jgi:hypothetical protein
VELNKVTLANDGPLWRKGRYVHFFFSGGHKIKLKRLDFLRPRQVATSRQIALREIRSNSILMQPGAPCGNRLTQYESMACAANA